MEDHFLSLESQVARDVRGSLLLTRHPALILRGAKWELDGAVVLRWPLLHWHPYRTVCSYGGPCNVACPGVVCQLLYYPATVCQNSLQGKLG